MKNRVGIGAVLLLAAALIVWINKDSFKTIPAEQGDMMAEASTSTNPVDIRSDKFFWRLQPWKDGKLATLDGWARFSELSFVGADKIKIDALVKFPNMPLDPFFIVWPEANLWYSQSARMDHVAYMETKFTKSFIPFMNGNYSETKPFLLDKDEGLLAFVYYRDGYGENEKKYVLYNYKKDILLDDDPEDIDVYYIGFLDADSLLALTETFENEEWVRDYFLYDWKTGKKTENNLTKKLTELAMTEIYCRAVGNVNTKNRFLIAKSEALGGHVKINWDEDFKDVTVTPINVLIPKDKYYSEFTISSGGEWAHSLVGGIRGFTKNGFISTRFIILTTGIPAG